MMYFGAASLWGFLVGAICMAVAHNLPAGATFGILAVLAAGAAVAGAGGTVTASAYREARKRAASS